MRKLASILTLLVFAVTFAVAQNAAPVAKAAAAKETAGAKIVFEKETIDYGVIQQNADPIRIFKFKNTGTEPLLIKNAQGSCGCTVPTYPTEPILPGESGEIKVKYDTSRIGKFSKRVTLTTNATATETVVLTINGEVLKKETPQGVPGAEKSIFNNN